MRASGYVSLALAAALMLSQYTATASQASASLRSMRGEQSRTYDFAPGADGKSTYRLYVPSTWSPNKRLPLVVFFHGGRGDENSLFSSEPVELRGVLQREADKHGFIIVSPRGLPHGKFGADIRMPAGMTNPDPTEWPEQLNTDSEQDALTAIERTIAEYHVDIGRIYLTGISMGEAATLHFAQKYAGRWCAIAPADGPIDVSDYPFVRLQGLAGAMVIHGDQDKVALLERNAAIAAQIRNVVPNTTFITVAGGGHISSWYMALPQIFAFFDRHRCTR